MRTLLPLFVLLFAVSQQPLEEVAQAARAALEAGDLDALFAGANRIQLHLPQVEPSGPVGSAQAAAVLGRVLAAGGSGGANSARVRVARFGEVGEDGGYVELRREVSLPGRGSVRQRVLLGFRRSGQGWRLVEIRVT